MSVTNISTMFFVEQARSGLGRIQQDLLDTQRQISSGQRVENLRDANIGAAPIISARTMMAQAQAQSDALQALAPRLEAQDLALGNTGAIGRGLRDEILKMITLGDASPLADKLQTAFTSASTEVNATWNGAYVFGGERTDQAPMTATSLTALAAAPSGQAAFAESQRTQTIDFGDGFKAQAADHAVDFAGPLFDAFRDLKTLLDANGGALPKPLGAADKTALQAAIAKIDISTAAIGQAQARNGDLQNRVETESAAATKRVDALTKSVGDQVDADLAALSVRLSALQVQYQASATTFSRLKDMNLMNFLQ